MKRVLGSLSLATLLYAPILPAEASGRALQGWQLLAKDYNQNHPLDFMTIEWQYFMVHDASGQFNGIVGYVLTNPRGKGGPVGSLVIPKGGNVAIGGEIHGQKAIGEYINFGIGNTEAHADTIKTRLHDAKTGYWASIDPLDQSEPALHLQGKTEKFAWDLYVEESTRDVMEQARANGAAFTPIADFQHAGHLPGESWTVDAIWPRTKVRGTIEVLETGEVLSIEGKGYRENSWGRYAMPLDGWDFFVFSEYDEDGVIAVLQTYHTSSALDVVDLAFLDDGERKIVRFQGSDRSFQWRHRSWAFDAAARQCVPDDWEIYLENATYAVTLHADIPANAQAPFLSNKTLGTSIFFIQEQYPRVKGTIYRKADHSVVTEFSGVAGGEFALHKSFVPKKSDETCDQWGKRFSNWYR